MLTKLWTGIVGVLSFLAKMQNDQVSIHSRLEEPG